MVKCWKVFKNYQADKDDFSAIKEALELTKHPGLEFIFRQPERIKDTVVVSYDSNFIFLWSPKKFVSHNYLNQTGNYDFYRILHKLRLRDHWQVGWRTGVEPLIKNLLPSEIRGTNDFQIPKISGGLLTPFISLQTMKKLKLNPYSKKEGFLATIIHEFAHVYWNSYRMWWLSRKDNNLKTMCLALKLYQKKGGQHPTSIFIPTPSVIGEIFAFCTEYYVSQLFWPTHKKLLDLFAEQKIKELIAQEEYKNLDEEDSTIEPPRHPHEFSLVYGKIIFEKYPNNWPVILTDPKILTTSL